MSSSRSISREIRKVLYGSASVLAGLGAVGPVYADDQATGSGNVADEVVVYGIRASLQQSLDLKRNAAGVVDAITAEDVGKFPDKNLAEALQRVPGVVINREFGEGERVNLRGTAATLTRTLLNGHALATADWFILDQLNTTRSFNYLMLPSDIIGQVAVYKSPTADLEEGGIGGTIDVATRKPLDMEPFVAYASFTGAYTEMSEDFDPQFSGMLSWRDEAGTLGVLIAPIYQERHIRRDGVEVLGYEDSNPSPTVTGPLMPSLIGSALFQQERIRQGLNFTLQLQPTDALSLNLSALYSEFQADNINENFLAWGTRAIANGGTLTNVTMQGDTAVAGTIASASNGTADFAVVYDAIDRFAKATTDNVDLDVNFRPSDSWGLHLRVGVTDADGNTDAQPFVEFGAPGTFTYDLRGSSPQVDFSIDPTDPTDLQFIFGSLHQILNTDKESYAYLDFDKVIDAGMLKSLKFGAKHTDHDRELTFNGTTYGGFFAPMNTTPAATFAGGLTPSDFLENVAASGTLTSYWQVDRDAVEDILFARLQASGRVSYPQQEFTVNEKSYAGYAMGNFAGDNWRGNAGVRVVRTEQFSSGNQGNGGPGSIANPFGPFIPVSADRTYTDVLPSINFAYDLNENMVLRFAAARVMARPDFTDIVPRVNVNFGALTAQSGDPDIDPYRANQADVSLEWYPGDASIVALALYYKDIKSFITDRQETRIIPVVTATPNAACTPTGTTNLFNCPFLTNVRSNGGGGKIQGAELSVTYPIWGGLGIQGNYTYSDADADNGDPIPGNSKDTFNAAAFFENKTVSARLAYTFRSEFFVTFDRSTRLNQADLEQLDASVQVNVLDNLALTFDAVNITDEKIEQFASEEFRPRAIYDNGRAYYAGVRLKF